MSWKSLNVSAVATVYFCVKQVQVFVRTKWCRHFEKNLLLYDMMTINYNNKQCT